MGGAGTDLIEGRGGDDIIDGDAQLNVRISVRSARSTEPTTQIDSVETLAGVSGPAARRNGQPGSAAHRPGDPDPGERQRGRRGTVLRSSGGLHITLATVGGQRVLTVTDTVGTDGIDTVRNVETLRFTDLDVATSTITAPAPVATVSTNTVAFGPQNTGATATQDVVVTNDGSANLTVSAATITPAGPFSVVTNGCTAAVAPAGTCTITVGFRPTTTATVTAQLSVTHNAPGSPTLITLTGQGRTPVVQPVITLPATTDFGRRARGTTRTQNVRVQNNGPGALLFAAVNPVRTTGAFTATLGNCPVAPATLAAGRSCSLSVSFRPTAVGPVTGSLTVTSNAVGSPRTVALTGTGR